MTFESLNLLGSFTKIEGCAKIRIGYLGGLAVQFSFRSKEKALKFP